MALYTLPKDQRTSKRILSDIQTSRPTELPGILKPASNSRLQRAAIQHAPRLAPPAFSALVQCTATSAVRAACEDRDRLLKGAKHLVGVDGNTVEDRRGPNNGTR